MFAVSTGSIGVDLQDIPNEPIRFIVRLNFVLIDWGNLILIRLIQRIEVVVKMRLLHGHGRHLLRIQIIRMFFFVCL